MRRILIVAGEEQGQEGAGCEILEARECMMALKRKWKEIGWRVVWRSIDGWKFHFDCLEQWTVW